MGKAAQRLAFSFATAASSALPAPDSPTTKPEFPQVLWKSDSSQADKGFGIVVIPEQAVGLGPFLIKTQGTLTTKRSGLTFGYAVRRRDSSEPSTLQEIHRLVRDGLQYQSAISNRFDALEALLSHKTFADETPRINVHGQDDVQISALAGKRAINLAERIERAAKEAQLREGRYFGIAAVCDPPSEPRTLFKSGQQTLGAAINDPPQIRSDGFGVFAGESNIVAAEYRRAALPNYKVLEAFKDSTLIFVADAGEGYLCHGTGNTINTLTLVESVYHFCLLYERVIADTGSKPPIIKFTVQFFRMYGPDDQPLIKLSPFPIADSRFKFSLNNRSSDKSNGILEIPIQGYTYDVGRAAYQVLNKIFLWFGVESDNVPYAREEGEFRVIDPMLILAAGS